jgi:hypothetical protein
MFVRARRSMNDEEYAKVLGAISIVLFSTEMNFAK